MMFIFLVNQTNNLFYWEIIVTFIQVLRLIGILNFRRIWYCILLVSRLLILSSKPIKSSLFAETNMTLGERNKQLGSIDLIYWIDLSLNVLSLTAYLFVLFSCNGFHFLPYHVLSFYTHYETSVYDWQFYLNSMCVNIYNTYICYIIL